MKKEIYLAGGCFWGVEKYLKSLPGVEATEVGYTNGKTQNPSYEDVCYRDSGHTEAVRVEYNPDQISLSHILHMYFDVIDPTSLNRQGNDIGKQYRTGIYYVDPEDEAVIKDSLAMLQSKYEKPLAIEIGLLENYYPAEDYHQDYLSKNPGGYCHIGSNAFDRAARSIVDPTGYMVPSDNELKNKLSSLQYKVTRENATEPPYQNEFHDHYEPGIYVDIISGEPLFTSADKFDACGWPSFSKAIDPSTIKSKTDYTHGMIREEVRSRISDSHLGHVFHDGPKELGGLRYCINSASLRFIPKEEMESQGYGKYLKLVK